MYLRGETWSLTSAKCSSPHLTLKPSVKFRGKDSYLTSTTSSQEPNLCSTVENPKKTSTSHSRSIFLRAAVLCRVSAHRGRSAQNLRVMLCRHTSPECYTAPQYITSAQSSRSNSPEWRHWNAGASELKYLYWFTGRAAPLWWDCSWDDSCIGYKICLASASFVPKFAVHGEISVFRAEFRSAGLAVVPRHSTQGQGWGSSQRSLLRERLFLHRHWVLVQIMYKAG